MNRPIRKVAIAIAVLFVALFVNLNVVQVLQASHYRDDPKNTQRLVLSEYSNPRGQIVVSGTAVATSVKTADELKYLRRYPDGPVYAPVTGSYSFVFGKTGIESAENSVLTGDDNRLFTTKLTDVLTGRDVRGGSVELTVNGAAQQAAYKAMGSRRGAVVALDPKTGAILAAVSTPSYDPNKLSSHNPDAIIAENKRLNEDPNNPTLDRALRGVYPAGSTFKLIDTAAALNQNPQLTPDTRLPAPNDYRPLEVANTKPCPKPNTGPCVANFDNEQCDNGTTATLALSLAKSCNTTFAKLVSETVGGDRIAAEAQKFGLDAPYTGSPQDLCADPPAYKTPLSVCRSSPGSITDLANRDTLAQTAIGQRDVRVTPLQIAMLSAAVANNGTLMKPYLVNKELRPDLSTLKPADPQQLNQVLDPQRDTELMDMMFGVVESPKGTGGPARITELPGVRVGGKTGTADHGVPDSKTGKQPPPHAWFTGFALAKGDPKIAVAVIIEDGGVSGNETTGGLAAAPVAKKVMLAYLREIGVR
ncbi:MAG: peptidoglycan D,D-transpeptidase FtsI family protein [Jatrophihabitans sp.]